MSNATHTQGPWFVEKPLTGGTFISKENGHPISAMCGYYPNAYEANARLIAAAPELLESLTGLVGLARMGAAALYKYEAALKDAEAAIRKATGAQS